MNYVNEVAELFSRRCRGGAVLNPEDYAVIAEWEKQEIPLSVVLECITQESERLRKENIKIDSIAIFHDAVKANYRRWIQERRVAG